MNKEPTCRFGHQCTSGCGNDYDCPCDADHCCEMTNDCEGGEHCDDHYVKEIKPKKELFTGFDKLPKYQKLVDVSNNLPKRSQINIPQVHFPDSEASVEDYHRHNKYDYETPSSWKKYWKTALVSIILAIVVTEILSTTYIIKELQACVN